MSELVPRDDVPDDEAALLDYVVGIIEEGRRVTAVRVNATLTMTHWLVGRAIAINSLRDGRAGYGKQILGTLSQELSTRSRCTRRVRRRSAPTSRRPAASPRWSA